MNKIMFSIFIFISLPSLTSAQAGYWQQHVNYKMDVTLNAKTNIINGAQKIEYINNSPDQLHKIFIHLFWNAFQPGSEMDVRSRELGKILINGNPDWDSRVNDRISKLTPSEIGYQQVKSIKMNGIEQPVKLHGTILEVNLTKPILPKTQVTFEIVFEAQVPLQIRRSGRDNAEGIRYSMSQWYPKICEYDKNGWHTAQYVAREFYGVWGNFDVTIKIDRDYKIGASGILENASSIGWGYDKPGTPLKKINAPLRTWHFVAKDVHDFVWAADPYYEHLVSEREGTVLNVIYKKKDIKTDSAWANVMDAAYTVLPFMNKQFGKYIYPQYSFIQGGDGGMEYPMATLLKGPGIGTVFHEWMHSWYQMMLGTDETEHPWMDEGFTSWASGEVNAYYRQQKQLSPSTELPLNHAGSYRSYMPFASSRFVEPMTTFADHYNTNYAYGINAYSKGAIFLEQLGYIVGDSVRNKILLEYYNRWKLKHPSPDDFMKVAKDVSGIQLDWYKEYWINTTKTIDYKIDSIWEDGGKSIIRLRRVGEMPMPIDLKLTFKDNSGELHYIPLDLMMGGKPGENADSSNRVVHDEWNWTNPTYNVIFDRRVFDLRKIEIDPTRRMADIDPGSNSLTLNW